MTLRISNGKFLEVLDPIPVDPIGWEVKVFMRGNPNTLVTIVPRWTYLFWSKPLSDIGSFEIQIMRDDRIFTDALPTGVVSSILDEDETIWKIYKDGIWRGSFYAEDVDKNHIDDQNRATVKITGRAVGKILEHATVLPPGYPSFTTKDHSWDSTSVMAAWRSLYVEAENRGAIPVWFSAPITSSTDTSGVAWADSSDILLPPGGNLLELLRRFAEVASVDWIMSHKFKLDVRRDFGNHRENEVVFHASGSVLKLGEQRTRRDIKSHIFAEAGTGQVVEANDTNVSSKWGRREIWVEVSDAKSTTTAGTYATRALETVKREARQVVGKILPEGPGREALVDYDIGDWIKIETDETDSAGNPKTEIVKIVNMAFKVDENGVTDLELAFSTKLQERLIRMQQALNRLYGSSQVSPTNSQAKITSRQVLSSARLNDLLDVTIVSPADNQPLLYDTASGEWKNQSFNNVISLDQLSDVVASGAAHGNALIFDITSGNWIPGEVSGGGGGGASNVLIAVKTADQSRTNNATAVADPDLHVGPLIPTKSYIVSMFLYYNAGATPDIRWNLDVPAGATFVVHRETAGSGVAGTFDALNTAMADEGISTDATDDVFIMHGLLTMSTTPGDLTLKWGQSTASATATTVKAKSWLRVEEIDPDAVLTPGTTLDELGDVVITAPADGHVLTYDTTNGRWQNEAAAFWPLSTDLATQAELDAINTALDARLDTIEGNIATQTELDAHINDTDDAHDASAISYAGGTGMSATSVEAAIDELATEKADATALANFVTKDGGGAEEYQNHGNTGATETIDLANGNVHRIVLDTATVALTFPSGLTAGFSYSFTLYVVQDATGGRAVTWPGSVDWPLATAPSLSAAANAVDVFVFTTIDGGTTWYGWMIGKSMG